MGPGDLIFGKSVLLQTYTGKSLVNLKGIKVELADVSGGDAACVQLVRNDDGTVSIQAMHGKHYLSVYDISEVDGNDHGNNDDESPGCYFDGCEIEAHQKFRLKFVDERAFVLKSEHCGFELEHNNGEVVCERHLNDKAPSMLWVLQEPATGAPLSLPPKGGLGVAEAKGFHENKPTSAIQTEEAFNKRHDAIMKMVLAGKSVQYIDDILSRLYGSK
ncbi:hypothetical protein PHYPSEUDO_002747 [Phytophthora pseudosyringae]|uniref:Uncharacterized protein n=1 Tax=Phytophthora pseudosyringae TaxID=221518 RepID=A0A8T1VWQ7_9STRA|nr:hypothetical protein PHYPSEUDO_002747 [Phytophthora pseudosyringae]